MLIIFLNSELKLFRLSSGNAMDFRCIPYEMQIKYTNVSCSKKLITDPQASLRLLIIGGISLNQKLSNWLLVKKISITQSLPGNLFSTFTSGVHPMN